MRKTLFSLLIIGGVAGLIGSNGLLWAQTSCISVQLNFDKTEYAYGEPVGVEVVVSNVCNNGIWVNKGFSSQVYYQAMRLIDPSGRQIIAQPDAEHDEFPNTPPLPHISDPNNPNGMLQVAPCEFLPVGWTKTTRTDDLTQYFQMKFPLRYSAQVQLSAMIFKQGLGQAGVEQCDINNYDWLGVLKSQTAYISTEGTVKIHIAPNQWKLSWQGGWKQEWDDWEEDWREEWHGDKEGWKEEWKGEWQEEWPEEHTIPYVQVRIRPGKGMTVDDFRLDSISLNNLVAPKRIKKLRSMVKVYFDPKEAINSLGPVQVGNWYPVTIWGKLTNDNFFGGSQKVRIR